MIRRYLLARSAEQFSRVKIGALHSGKGYREIKKKKKKKKKGKGIKERDTTCDIKLEHVKIGQSRTV